MTVGVLRTRADWPGRSVGLPGPSADGTTLLPNGWRLSPAGKHVKVGDLPLNILQTPDSKYLVVTSNGLAKPSFAIVDIATWTVKSTMPLDHGWLGMAWSPDGTKLYSSGAAQNNVQEFSYAGGVITRSRTFALPAAGGETFVGGLAIAPDGKTLYATRVYAQTLSAIEIASGRVLNTISLPAEPYTSVVSPDGKMLYVSLWGGSRVQVYVLPSLTLLEELTTAEHPSAMVLSPDGDRLFVACASSSTVWVFNVFSGEALEQISMSLYPNAPATSTPNSLALSPDGKTLLVANADINAVAVVDVGNAGRSFVTGFVPSGWYPTGAIFSRDGASIFMLSGKGLVPAPKPTDGGSELRLQGAVSMLAAPDRVTLADYTRRVYAVTPYTDAAKMTPVDVPIGSPIPRAVGGSSPIKHVIYVIRENRTYDSILGDMRQGNGDPSLTLFGAAVTPNAHALADQFVLLDNFYVDADVSYDGHSFSTAAYATDVIQKTWQTFYGNRGGLYLGEGDGFMRNAFGNLTAPEMGYIWDFARRSRVTVRSYGEFAGNQTRLANGDVVAVASVPGLRTLVAPSFAAFDLEITDNKRVDTWLEEFNGFVADGNLPQLSIVHLGNDHTQGAKPGAPTPRAMIADNDLALGRLVEAVSNSVYWKDSAIFVVEDDAQSGPDHVDSHRSVALVASPFARRGFVDHTFYSTSGVLRTMELILGLPPMSQYDAAAVSLYNSFQSTPTLTTYRRIVPGVPLDERNPPTAAGAAVSGTWNFSDADLTPEEPLNEVIWQSVKGKDSPMPPPKRSVFVR
ncbi:MAG TPA: bifunctional YncE family protein/alkaline phosphatase family protein [Vicinamibacterales bacterium]|nr:bifunctional YncE family protein/alkaline phosphatase family protein [Vicinamibacterales bacterium]